MLPHKSFKGISLLELMLSLAIIAGLMFIVTTYYRQATEASKIKITQEQISRIFAKADEIRNLNKGYNFCSTSHAYFPMLMQAVDKAYRNSTTAFTPFGQHSDFNCSTSTKGKFIIKINSLPQNACTKLRAFYENIDGISIEPGTSCTSPSNSTLILGKTH